MLYRYRLRDGAENKGIKSLSVNRVILKKNKWYYSTYPQFHEYLGSRVEEQTANTMETFPADTKQRDDLVKQLQTHPKTELRAIAKSIGLPESSIHGKKKDDLIEMIADY